MVGQYQAKPVEAMAAKVTEGCVVSIPAMFFDGQGSDKQSQEQFGNMWSTARCSAVVQRVLQGGKWCRVKWDIDGAITQVAVQDLRVDEIPSADSSEETVVSDVRTVLPACH